MTNDSTPAERLSELAQKTQQFFEEVRGRAEQWLTIERVGHLALSVARAASDHREARA